MEAAGRRLEGTGYARERQSLDWLYEKHGELLTHHESTAAMEIGKPQMNPARPSAGTKISSHKGTEPQRKGRSYPGALYLVISVAWCENNPLCSSDLPRLALKIWKRFSVVAS
jgi:hypothetical protein